MSKRFPINRGSWFVKDHLPKNVGYRYTYNVPPVLKDGYGRVLLMGEEREVDQQFTHYNRVIRDRVPVGFSDKAIYRDVRNYWKRELGTDLETLFRHLIKANWFVWQGTCKIDNKAILVYGYSHYDGFVPLYWSNSEYHALLNWFSNPNEALTAQHAFKQTLSVPSQVYR